MRCSLFLVPAVLAFVAPAQAQQRVLVIPAGTEVAVPARGMESAATVRAPRPRLGRGRGSGRGVEPVGGGDSLLGGNLGLGLTTLVALPLAAAAAAFVASGVTPGSGSTTSAPARTR
jgi:hypothetical protein